MLLSWYLVGLWVVHRLNFQCRVWWIRKWRFQLFLPNHDSHLQITHIFFHSFLHPSDVFLHSSSNPHTVYFFEPCFPSSIPLLQALFVRRFFSCSCQLKYHWKVTRLTLDLSFMSCSTHFQKLLNLTAVHAVLQQLLSSLIHHTNHVFSYTGTWPAQAVYSIH